VPAVGQAGGRIARLAEKRWCVAILPLYGQLWRAHTRYRRPVRTGGKDLKTSKGLTAAMELLFILALFLVLALASALGLTKDSRDGADWTPSDDGRRVPRHLPRHS
jgi:hypothetical protein